MITSGDKKFVAKFSSQTDLYGVVKAKFVAMRLAAAVGLTVAPVSLKRAAGKDWRAAIRTSIATYDDDFRASLRSDLSKGVTELGPDPANYELASGSAV